MGGRRLILLAFSLQILNLTLAAVEYAPIVKTKQGELRGIVQEADEGVNVYLYEGVRYGELCIVYPTVLTFYW